MNWKKFVCTALAVPILSSGVSLFKPSISEAVVSQGTGRSKLELRLDESPDSFVVPLQEGYSRFKGGDFNCKVQEDEKQLLNLKCEKKPQRRASFFFDDSRFTLGNLRHGDSEAIDQLIGGDGRLGLKALLGYEDFVLGIGAEQQTILQRLKVGISDEWDASIFGVSYHINLDFRWYFGEKRNMFVGVGNDHISDRLIDGDVEYEKFFLEHPEVTIDSPVIDVVSYQFGGKFLISDRIHIEGRVGRNMYQTAPLYTFSALWDKSKRGPRYPYNGFLEVKVPYEFSEHWKVYGQIQSEFNSHKRPTNWRLGIEKDFAPYPFGVRFYFGKNTGRDSNTLEKTRFGIESNGDVRMFEVFANIAKF